MKLKLVAALMLAVSPLYAFAEYMDLPSREFFEAGAQRYMGTCYQEVVNHAFWGTHPEPGEQEFLLQNQPKVLERMLKLYGEEQKKSDYQKSFLAEHLTEQELALDLQPGERTCQGGSGWREVGETAARDLLRERKESAHAAVDQKRADANRQKLKENPPAQVDFDAHTQGIGSDRVVHFPAAGSDRSIGYAAFKKWYDTQVAEFNPVVLNTNPASAHRTCKASIAKTWKTSFGYPHASVSFKFSDGTVETYSRASVTNGACLTSMLQLAGVSVNND